MAAGRAAGGWQGGQKSANLAASSCDQRNRRVDHARAPQACGVRATMARHALIWIKIRLFSRGILTPRGVSSHGGACDPHAIELDPSTSQEKKLDAGLFLVGILVCRGDSAFLRQLGRDRGGGQPCGASRDIRPGGRRSRSGARRRGMLPYACRCVRARPEARYCAGRDCLWTGLGRRVDGGRARIRTRSCFSRCAGAATCAAGVSEYPQTQNLISRCSRLAGARRLRIAVAYCSMGGGTHQSGSCSTAREL